MRPAHHLLILLVAVMPSASYSQTKPATSGDVSYGEPELRKHHGGLFLPNQPGRPRVGYHKRFRKPRVSP